MSISLIQAITLDEILKKQEVQIASLTAENERLRALLKRWSNYDDLDRIMGGVEAYEKLSADTGNALQPKEGNQ